MGLKTQMQEVAHYRNAYALSLSAAMGSIFFGWDIGLIGGVISLPSFKESFGLDKLSAGALADYEGNIVSILQGGCFFGALSMGYFSNRFGRKPCLIAAGIIYIIGSTIQSICGLGSSQKVALDVLYFSRFLGGVGVGMVSALVPAYVSESVPRTIRGRCTGMIQLANNLGIMLSFWVNYSSSKDIPYGHLQWRVPFIVQMVPGVLFVLAMLFQPESPRWLVEHGHTERGAAALAYIARSHPEDTAVQTTLFEIQADFAQRAEVPMYAQFRQMGESRSIALRCFLPSLFMFFQQWTGTNSVNYFSPRIFTSLGISGVTAGLFATGIYGVVKTVCVALVLAFAVEGLGRKKCLIIGGLGQALMMIWIGGYGGVHGTSTEVVPASYVSIVAVYLYAVFYCIGWGPVPWVCAGEVAPNHLRGISLSIAVGVNWLFSFTISKITPIMLNSITYGTYLVFGFMCLIMAIWAYFFYPETSGVALEDMKYIFEGSVTVRALQDAPGGKLFLGGRRAPTVEELRARDLNLNAHSDEPEADLDDGTGKKVVVESENII